MEDKIREYEEYIEEKASENLSASEREKLAEYHNEMVQNFQHERVIHLIVTFFFVSIALMLLAALGYELCVFGPMIEMCSFYLLTGIVVILSFFYVKHYYFLENHVQEMYKYNRILHVGKKDK